MLLYGFGESGNAYKVALALRLMEVEWELRLVDFYAGEARGPDFLAINPMGEIPVLVDGETTLTQSGAILDYLASKTGKLGGRSAAERREVLRWLFWDNHKFTSQIAMLRFMLNYMPEAKRPEGVIPFLQGRVKAATRVLEGHLSTHDWVIGDTPTIADISLCAYPFMPEEKGMDRADWPAIDAWLTRIESLPNWAHSYDIMPRVFRGH